MHNGIGGWSRLGFLFSAVLAATGHAASSRQDLNGWIADQTVRSRDYLMENLSPAGTVAGVVVASPSRSNPDYFYHWVRDAGLVMDAVVSLSLIDGDEAWRADYEKRLLEFVDFSRRNQLTPTPSNGFGEPKFNVDGTAFTGPWGRPQNDGPALRAVALIRFAHRLLNEGKVGYVREKLYDGKLPSRTVVKADLEFVAQRWRETSFDLWEEVKGHHVYTLMAQRRSLIDGAALAIRLDDEGAAKHYLTEARAIESELVKHWDPDRGILVVTRNRDGGIDYKHSGLDASVILASMHGATGDGFLGVTDERVLATFVKVREAFRALYPINRWRKAAGVAIGRYPEDRYDGNGTSEGNPWFLLTMGFGEYLHRVANAIVAAGTVPLSPVSKPFFDAHGITDTTSVDQAARLLREEGDNYLARARFHGISSGRFSEQINRHSGYMQGAHDLTWSYAAFLTAAIHRAP